MAFSVAVAGTSLQLVLTDGTVTTVTLPTGVVVVSGQVARFAILGKNVIVANAVSEPIWIDPAGVARKLRLMGPLFAPTLAAGAAGTLSGTFKVRVRFVLKDEDGNDIMVSDASPESADVTVTNQLIAVSNISTSAESFVNCRRLSRTADGPGEEYFDWLDIDDNTTTSFSDDASDEALSVAAEEDDLGAAPMNLQILVEWKGRIWGKSPFEADRLRYTSLGKSYAWPVANDLPIQPVGRDLIGITGLMKRRDELGVSRRDVIWKVIGSDETNFELVKVVEGKGVISHDTIVVTRDVARFLGEDGVYEWDEGGVRSISDEAVQPWFTTDTYFNRALFPSAFARFEPYRNSYDLFLAAAGSSSIDRWVSYDIDRKRWMGPHKTDAFTPTAAGVVYDASELLIPVAAGSDGLIYKVTPGTYRDGSNTAIAFDVTGKFHSGAAPDVVHYWGELSILTRVEAGGTLTITPKVGRLDAAAQTSISHDLTLGRQRLRRLGVGPLMNLRFQNSEANQRVELYGYEVDWFQVGRR